MHTQLPPVVAGMVVASWGPDFLMLEDTGCTVHKSQWQMDSPRTQRKARERRKARPGRQEKRLNARQERQESVKRQGREARGRRKKEKREYRYAQNRAERSMPP